MEFRSSVQYLMIPVLRDGIVYFFFFKLVLHDRDGGGETSFDSKVAASADHLLSLAEQKVKRTVYRVPDPALYPDPDPGFAITRKMKCSHFFLFLELTNFFPLFNLSTFHLHLFSVRIRIGLGFNQVSGSAAGSRRAKIINKNRKTKIINKNRKKFRN
jgi:hypothetical protein